MDEIKTFFSTPYSYLAIGIAALVGVWWWKMNPASANLTLVLGVLALTVAAFLFIPRWFDSPPVSIRLLWTVTAFSVLSLAVYYTLWTSPQGTAKPDELNRAQSAAIAELSKLGWTVKPGPNDIEFEIWGKPLPSMKESAPHFKQLNTPFRLHFQSIKSIDGLRELADVVLCSKIEINAGEFSDISELRGFSHLLKLVISQTPISGFGTIDSSPLSGLAQLQELNLGFTKITTLDSIAKLTELRTLYLRGTLIRDLSPLAELRKLESIDVTETTVTDLSALEDHQELKELGLDAKQIAGLAALKQLKNLRSLRIIEQTTFDLSPIGGLSNLESLYIWGPPLLNLSPLRNLTKMQSVQLSGALTHLSVVEDVEALGELRDLKQLTLGFFQINDLSFVRNLKNLTQINLGEMPITSIEPLRGLKSLKTVTLNRTLVVDISPLLDLPALESLSIGRTPARVDVLSELERRGVSIQR